MTDRAAFEARLLSLIAYDAATGILSWKAKPNRNMRVGSVIGRPNSWGHVSFGFMGRTWMAHRVAWFIHHGSWPVHQIDHIDGDKQNNRISNLRDVPQNLNMQNRNTPKKDNQSGYLGVVRIRGITKPWRAKIKVDNKWHSLGCYATPEEAHAAYMARKMELHPWYASAAAHLGSQA